MKEEPAFQFNKMRDYFQLNRIYYPSEFMRLVDGSSLQGKEENTIIRGGKMKEPYFQFNSICQDNALDKIFRQNTIIRGGKMKKCKEIRATDGRFHFWVEEEGRGSQVFYEEYGNGFLQKKRHCVVLEQPHVFTCRFFYNTEKEAEKASKEIRHFLLCSCDDPLVLNDVGVDAE